MELAKLPIALLTPVPVQAFAAAERARQHVLAELRLVGHLTAPRPPAHLRLCT